MSITFQILFTLSVIGIAASALHTAWLDHLEAKELKRLNRAHAHAEMVVHEKWRKGEYAGASLIDYNKDYEAEKTAFLRIH